MKKNKLLVVVVLVVIAVGVVLGIKAMRTSGAQDFSTDMRSKGNPQAPIKVVEFIDFQCPACAYGSIVLDEYLKNHPEKLHVQLKHFPLRMHMNAITASLYVECAGQQGQFWAFHDVLIQNQQTWAKMTVVRPYFMDYVNKLGLDANKLSSCIEQDSVRQHIINDQEEGRRRGVRSTPTYFINGDLVAGTKSLTLKLDELLKNE